LPRAGRRDRPHDRVAEPQELIMSTSSLLSRRTVLLGGAILPAVLAGGAARTAPPPPLPPMTIHRDPGCGCCGNWADLARRAGYPVRVVDEADMPGLKRRLNVPRQLEACHTAVVAGYVIEGHVPLNALAWLLARHPRGLRGLGVPGMPAGSPGMETPGAAREPFQVFAFNAAGQVAPVR
jgi:hypothetical protein